MLNTPARVVVRVVATVATVISLGVAAIGATILVVYLLSLLVP